MNETDWEAKYQAGEMRWDKGAPCPGLVDFLEAHPELSRSAVVCVPGCGTGSDVRAWAQAGFEAHGFDLAPTAIRLCHERTQGTGLTRAHYHLANFLTDPPPQRFDWLFEHTLFCAILPSQRAAYVQAVRRWLKPGGQFLAVHYMDPQLDPGEEGPPFGTTREEILERFSPWFELKADWVPRSYPNRENRERMFWWELREG